MSAAWEELDIKKLVAEAIESDNGPILGTGLARPVATQAVIAQAESPEEADGIGPEPSEVSPSNDAASPDPLEAKEEVDVQVEAADEPGDPEIAEPATPTSAPPVAPEAPQDVQGNDADTQSQPPEDIAQGNPWASGGIPDDGVDLAGEPDPEPEPEVAGPESLEFEWPSVSDVESEPQPDIFDVDEQVLEHEVWSLPDEMKQIQEPHVRDSLQFDFGDTLAGQAAVAGDRSGGY